MTKYILNLDKIGDYEDIIEFEVNSDEMKFEEMPLTQKPSCITPEVRITINQRKTSNIAVKIMNLRHNATNDHIDSHT